MASMQEARSSSRVNEKHRGLLNKMKQELGAQEGNMAQAAQATTRAAMYNNGVDTVKFLEKNDWSGKIFGHFPANIAVNKDGSFTHRGVPPADTNGSKGGIVYVGPNVRGGPENCAWVLAWSAPGDGSGNKVYVETGPASRYPKGSIDWDAIENKLDSASSECHFFDNTSKTEISADIDANGNTPKIAAVFDVSL